MTKVIAIVSEKGGTGKTTTVVSLAVAAEGSGLKTVVFDLDPGANASAWGDAREGKPPDVHSAHASRLHGLIAKVTAQKADLVIVDTPSNAREIAGVACTAADLILLPCKPSAPDLVTIAVSIENAQKSGKPNFALINDAPYQGPEVTEATSAFEKNGMKVCPVIWYHRKDFTRYFHMGLTAPEFDPTGKAAEEVNALFSWVRVTMGLNGGANHGA